MYGILLGILLESHNSTLWQDNLKGSAPNINLAQNEKIVLHRFALTQYRNLVFVFEIF